jgi:hypothetical protein
MKLVQTYIPLVTSAAYYHLRLRYIPLHQTARKCDILQ